MTKLIESGWAVKLTIADRWQWFTSDGGGRKFHPTKAEANAVARDARENLHVAKVVPVEIRELAPKRKATVKRGERQGK